MARYLLDTTICLYIAKHHPPTVWQRFEQLTPKDLAISVITYAELRCSAEKCRQRDEALAVLHALVAIMPLLPLPEMAGAHYGWLRAVLDRAGKTLGNNDLWIAAHALAEDLTLVTCHERTFSWIPGLRIENWVA